MNLSPGRTLLHYRIVEKIGAGGMGEVWKAIDTRLKREVAIKVLPSEMAGDADRLRRFETEAHAVAALNHPNIITIHAVEEAEGAHFLVMELVKGRPLSAFIPADGLATGPLLELAVPLCRAMAAAHKQGIVHRDLKPDNVMVDNEGRVKVLDFGLARLDPLGTADDATRTAEGRILGTVAYMSPEQAQGREIGSASDVFSLGTLLYEMATGKRPFGGENNVSVLTSILRDTPPDVTTVNPETSEPFDRIIARCLAKDPATRYETAEPLAAELADLRAALNSMSSTSLTALSPAEVTRTRQKRTVAIIAGVAIVVAVIAVAGWYVQREQRRNWAFTQAIPRIGELYETSSWLEWGPNAWEADELARQSAVVLGDDPVLIEAWDQVTRSISITSEPGGATVFAESYAEPDGPWRTIGKTPLEKFRFPRGASRIRVELSSRRLVEDLIFNVGFSGGSWHYRLFGESEIPDEMVFVPGEEVALMLPGVDHLKPKTTTDFLIDAREVTNREYKAFIDVGGYEDPSYWTHPFRDGERTLSFDQAMEKFLDRTGRPGPAEWEVGDFPEGKDEFPVGGISWFEAAAYLKYTDKQLPTIYHWNQAALPYASGEVVPLSNLEGEAPRSSAQSVVWHRFGTRDMAGNVREWCANETPRNGSRFILGGGWDDAGWAFNDAYTQSPWDRSPTNGVRGIRERQLNPELYAALAHAVEMPFRDFNTEQPVSDETFELFRRMYEYDPGPLNAEIVETREYDDWTRQRITFDAAYGGERMQALLFLPKLPPPHKAIVYFPGSGAIHSDSSENVDGDRFKALLKSGRAVMHPIYKGTFERGDELTSDYAEETIFYKDHVVMWGKDLSRSIDYLESRDDLDALNEPLVFYGVSWGGVLGTILPAVEPRIDVVMLHVAGLMFQRALPEAEQINYIPRITQPVLMVNGERDFFFPVETAQKPLYELLGTPAEHKKYVVYPGSHSVPRVDLVRELLAWLDRYQ